MFYSLNELLDMAADKVKNDYGRFTNNDKNAICLRIEALKKFIAELGKTDGKR